jgi:hypothetical protein
MTPFARMVAATSPTSFAAIMGVGMCGSNIMA